MKNDGSAPSELDARLAVRIGACLAEYYLVGNPHTFLGRIATWCPLDEVEVKICKTEVVRTSPEAEIWLDGFLAGNEPPPPDSDDPVDEQQSERVRREFRLRGVLPED